jgi:hypothetical protein
MLREVADQVHHRRLSSRRTSVYRQTGNRRLATSATDVVTKVSLTRIRY